MKPKLLFLSVITVSVLLSVSAMTADAQIRNPTQQEIAHARSTGPCQDPLISIALTYKRLGNYMTGSSTSYIAGVGTYGECNPALYNGGSWSSFDELNRGVQTTLNNLSGIVRISMASLGNNQVKITTDAGSGFVGSDTIKLIGHDSGSLINHDGASVIAQGGGNFHVQSLPNEKRVSLGKSVLIIRKK
jgi:hypothetical protein